MFHESKINNLKIASIFSSKKHGQTEYVVFMVYILGTENTAFLQIFIKNSTEENKTLSVILELSISNYTYHHQYTFSNKICIRYNMKVLKFHIITNINLI